MPGRFALAAGRWLLTVEVLAATVLAVELAGHPRGPGLAGRRAAGLDDAGSSRGHSRPGPLLRPHLMTNRTALASAAVVEQRPRDSGLAVVPRVPARVVGGLVYVGPRRSRYAPG